MYYVAFIMERCDDMIFLSFTDKLTEAVVHLNYIIIYFRQERKTLFISIFSVHSDNRPRACNERNPQLDTQNMAEVF